MDDDLKFQFWIPPIPDGEALTGAELEKRFLQQLEDGDSKQARTQFRAPTLFSERTPGGGDTLRRAPAGSVRRAGGASSASVVARLVLGTASRLPRRSEALSTGIVLGAVASSNLGLHLEQPGFLLESARRLRRRYAISPPRNRGGFIPLKRLQKSRHRLPSERCLCRSGALLRRRHPGTCECDGSPSSRPSGASAFASSTVAKRNYPTCQTGSKRVATRSNSRRIINPICVLPGRDSADSSARVSDSLRRSH